MSRHNLLSHGTTYFLASALKFRGSEIPKVGSRPGEGQITRDLARGVNPWGDEIPATPVWLLTGKSSNR